MIPDDPSATVFTAETRQEFLDQLAGSVYHITRAEKANIIDWLTNPARQPTCHAEANRRNYVRRTFTWARGRLYAQGQMSTRGRRRKVKTVDRIADVVERYHRRTAHGGRERTWRKIRKRYHGVLWPDVVFLLRRCEVCRERYPKRSAKAEKRRKDG